MRGSPGLALTVLVSSALLAGHVAAAPGEEGSGSESGVQLLRFVQDDAQDYKTMQFLDWFVKEQGEEEKNAEDLIKKMKLYGGDGKGLYMLNQELAARKYTAPLAAD